MEKTMDNIAIKVEHVQKVFKLPTEATKSLRTTLVNWFKGIRGYRKQEVLHDISFEVNKGDFFGIVGRNGSGKSTLLKIISQIYVPEKGNVTVNGSLSSFIELGVGFNEELTGRENVYLNGAMLGFSTEEVDAMYDKIVEFAELEEFMDQKLKNYSSGMQVRLSFSIAIQTNADVLILDEVLAVGDEAFQRKSREYFKRVREEGKTVVLVTHDMNAVREYCNKAMLINEGNVEMISEDVDQVALKYSELFVPEQLLGDDPLRFGNRKVTFEKYEHHFDAKQHVFDFTLKNNTDEVIDDLDMVLMFFQEGPSVGNHLNNSGVQLVLQPGEERDLQVIMDNNFGLGEFTVDLQLTQDMGRVFSDVIRIAFTFTNIYSINPVARYLVPMEIKGLNEHDIMIKKKGEK